MGLRLRARVRAGRHGPGEWGDSLRGTPEHPPVPPRIRTHSRNGHPAALNCAGLLLGAAGARPLWTCQNLGVPVLLNAVARLALGPYGQRPSTPGRRARIPSSPKVQRHQERSVDG